MLLANGFYGAGDAVLQWAGEIAPYPGAGGTEPSLALPSSFARPRFVQTLEGQDDNGGREVYGLGSRYPQVLIPGARDHRQNIAWAMPSSSTLDTLLAHCRPDANGKLPNVCFLNGARRGEGESAEGVLKAQRFAKCDSLEITLAAGKEATARTVFWFLAEEPLSDMPSGAVTVPFAPSMNVAPFTWGDVQEINMWGVNVRGLIDLATLKNEYALERTVYRPSFDTSTYISPWSRTTYYLKEGTFRFRAQLQFQTPDPTAYLKANGANSAVRALEIKLQKKERPTEKLTIWSDKAIRVTTGKGITSVASHVSRLSLALLNLDFAVA